MWYVDIIEIFFYHDKFVLWQRTNNGHLIDVIRNMDAYGNLCFDRIKHN